MAKNADVLHKAKDAKKDEFYYERQFKDKIILMNCDDPKMSNFWKYFHINFERFGLRKIIATHYECNGEASYKIEYTGGIVFVLKPIRKLDIER